MVLDSDPTFPNGRTIMYLVYYKDNKVIPYLKLTDTIIKENIDNISFIEQWIEDSNYNTMSFYAKVIPKK